MSDFARGGDDVAVFSGIVGDAQIRATNDATGDAVTMSGHAVGGSDILTGGDASGFPFEDLQLGVDNVLRGDASAMSGSAQGGNDVITGGNNIGTEQVNNFLYGDAPSLSDASKGGNDILIAGIAATDGTVINDMWGDGLLSGGAQGGQDQFVFKDAASMTVGTHNTIEDFSQSQHDQIKFVDVADVHSFNDLVIAQSGTGTVITAGADQVTLHNFTGSLTANDFLFV